jgi:hypothetical protein
MTAAPREVKQLASRSRAATRLGSTAKSGHRSDGGCTAGSCRRAAGLNAGGASAEPPKRSAQRNDIEGQGRRPDVSPSAAIGGSADGWRSDRTVVEISKVIVSSQAPHQHPDRKGHHIQGPGRLAGGNRRQFTIDMFGYASKLGFASQNEGRLGLLKRSAVI